MTDVTTNNKLVIVIDKKDYLEPKYLVGYEQCYWLKRNWRCKKAKDA